jgi:hypothetical protein
MRSFMLTVFQVHSMIGSRLSRRSSALARNALESAWCTGAWRKHRTNSWHRRRRRRPAGAGSHRWCTRDACLPALPHPGQRHWAAAALRSRHAPHACPGRRAVVCQRRRPFGRRVFCGGRGDLHHVGAPPLADRTQGKHGRPPCCGRLPAD